MCCMAHIYPFQLLLLTFSGLINRRQHEVIEFLVEENRVLREQLKGRRLRLNDNQRRRLALKGKQLGRLLLNRVATIVTPDTIMRWHRPLISLKWTYEQPKTARRGVMKAIRELIVRMAQENSTWGYTRIQGELKDLGHCVGRSTVARTLKDNGITPAPNRPSSWRTFLKAHWGEVAACDFFTTEVWTPRGLVTHYTLFLIDLKSRKVHIAGSTPKPDEAFMAQIARNLTDLADGFLLPHRLLICDRDGKFSPQFLRTLRNSRVSTVLTPYRAPNANAFAERFVRSIKEECLNRIVLFGEASLHCAVREFVEHYHGERPHQGLGNAVIDRPSSGPAPATKIRCEERLGGLLRHYRCAA